MADSEDLYHDDLYGDLDEQLLDEELNTEELIDPEAPAASAVKTEEPASNVKAEPASTNVTGGGLSQAGSSGQGQGVHGLNIFNGGSGQGADAGGSGSRPRDLPEEGKMFIGGLNWETTDDGLKNYMSQYGYVESCTIMRDANGRSRGFAFLTYSDPDSVTRVMGDTHHLDGKQIDPKRAIPKAEHERTAKVFVGGLAAGVTSESLKEFLGQFGQVMDATVMYDRETTRSKGFAFATFADDDAVVQGMNASQQGLELEGKQIEIKRAQPRGAGNAPRNYTANNPGGGRFGQQNGMQGGMGGNMGNMGYGGGMGGGGFDPMAMAMMYQNMMRNTAMGNMGMGGGFDPQAMATMYQSMMKNMTGMGNAPAINPNMAMRNGMGGNMGGGMGNMMAGGMGNMGGGVGMGMNNMGGMGMGNVGTGGGGQVGGGGNTPGGPIPNAPRGPAAMRNGPPGPGAGPQGTGAQRYSTQGSQRSRPY